MSKDLLPESLNRFLDDVDATLCLPILLGLILCTAQFIFNHFFDVGCTALQTYKEDRHGGGRGHRTVAKKIKGILSCMILGATPTICKKTQHTNPVVNALEDEWDYCDEELN